LAIGGHRRGPLSFPRLLVPPGPHGEVLSDGNGDNGGGRGTEERRRRLGPRNEARGGANGAGSYPDELEEDGGARDVAARLESFAGINGDPRQDVEGGGDFVVLWRGGVRRG
jgi:hypothetical protein